VVEWGFCWGFADFGWLGVVNLWWLRGNMRGRGGQECGGFFGSEFSQYLFFCFVAEIWGGVLFVTSKAE
jgi:hypothetical protein